MNTKFLIPIDGSDCCKAFLKWVSTFIPKDKSDIYLLYVGCVLPTEYPMLDVFSEASIPILEEGKAFLEEHGCRVVKTDYFETVSSVGRAICEYADSYNIDQIMMGSHGKTGLSNLFMGSVSQDVFRNAKQPVLVLNVTKIPSLQISHIDQTHPQFATTGNRDSNINI